MESRAPPQARAGWHGLPYSAVARLPARESGLPPAEAPGRPYGASAAGSPCPRGQLSARGPVSTSSSYSHWAAATPGTKVHTLLPSLRTVHLCHLPAGPTQDTRLVPLEAGSLPGKAAASREDARPSSTARGQPALLRRVVPAFLTRRGALLICPPQRLHFHPNPGGGLGWAEVQAPAPWTDSSVPRGQKAPVSLECPLGTERRHLSPDVQSPGSAR